MADLDCSSVESALESAAAVLSVAPGPLLDQLRAFDYSALPEAQWRRYAYEDLLVRHAVSANRYELPAPDWITWFHATRVPPSVDFAEGLLPLASNRGRIHSFMKHLEAQVRSNPNWMDVEPQRNGHGGTQYDRRMMGGGDEGPFAFLVRAAFFQHRSIGSHDYLGVPEIVEDLYLGYAGEYGQAFHAEYLKATEPCIVAFRMPGAQRPETVGAALNYIHRMSRGMELSITCNTCFNGEGVPIPRSAIIRIERGAGLAP